MITKITLEQAVDLLEQYAVPMGLESFPLSRVLGRTLAKDLTAPVSQPPFHRSPLDGYAVRSGDISAASKEHPVTLTVVDTVYAGDVADVPVQTGQAVRIMTGAMLPRGCDCVIMQERTDMGYPVVSVFQGQKPYDNYCYAGEDFKQGDLLLSSGTVLNAACIGVLASAGISEDIPVFRRPSVAVLSTGDEVVTPETKPLPTGKIYGSNAHLLAARLAELGIAEVTAEQVGDDAKAVADAMTRLLTQYDVIITTGGVSVGDKDIMHDALPLIHAEQIFYRVMMKPGTPAIFATHVGKPILCLSGNPFAASATFELLVRPLLAAMTGERALTAKPATATLRTPFPKASNGRRFIRARYEQGDVILPDEHSSGVLSSSIGCNCLVDLPAGTPPLEAGSSVHILIL